MNDLIDRNELIKAIEKHGLEWRYIRKLYPILQEIDEQPSVNIQTQKRGKWIKVGGYFTPGGDPVWKCSECGKGMHVYGIEAPSYNTNYADGQWVACPNCGTIMEDI